MFFKLLKGRKFAKWLQICFFLFVVKGCSPELTRNQKNTTINTEEITITIKVILTEGSVKDYLVDSYLNNKWIDIESLLGGSETIFKFINPDRILDVYAILRVEGMENPHVSTDIQKVIEGEDLIWNFRIPRKTVGRKAFLEIWDQDEEDNNALDSESPSIVEGVNKFIADKSLKIIREHDLFSVGDDLLGKTQFTIEETPGEKRFLLTKNVSIESLKVIHKILLEKNSFEKYIEELIHDETIIQDDEKNFKSKVGELKVTVFN